MNSWEKFYQKNSPENTPWTGDSKILFDSIWKKFGLPKNGTILDLGCGRGDKAIYFAKRGFKVYGIDISETAIKEARTRSLKMENPPIFIVGDIKNLEKIEEIRKVKFDLIVDLLVSQFLSDPEKVEFLDQLNSKYTSPAYYYILHTFTKDLPESPKNARKWVKEVAQNKEGIRNIYGGIFKTIASKDIKTRIGNSQIYILRKRGGGEK